MCYKITSRSKISNKPHIGRYKGKHTQTYYNQIAKKQDNVNNKRKLIQNSQSNEYFLTNIPSETMEAKEWHIKSIHKKVNSQDLRATENASGRP